MSYDECRSRRLTWADSKSSFKPSNLSVIFLSNIPALPIDIVGVALLGISILAGFPRFPAREASLALRDMLRCAYRLVFLSFFLSF